jgi:hypothetical protein
VKYAGGVGLRMKGDAADAGLVRHAEAGVTAAPARAAAAVRNPRRVGAYDVMPATIYE